MGKIPSEISLGWIYVPPILLDALIGFVLAYEIAVVLNLTRLSRFFVNPPLAFVAMWVLASSLVALFVFPP